MVFNYLWEKALLEKTGSFAALVFKAALLLQMSCLPSLQCMSRNNNGNLLFSFNHSAGAVETFAHRMPKGGCFQLVSCPHYFAELLIYVSLGFVFGGLSLTWWLVVLYVFFNQALAGQLSHELYVSKYQSYPKDRKAFIPFVL